MISKDPKKSSQERLSEVAEKRQSVEAKRLSHLSNKMGIEADRMERAQVLRDMNIEYKKELAHHSNQAVQDVHERIAATNAFAVPPTPTPSEATQPTTTTTTTYTAAGRYSTTSHRDSNSVSLTDLRAEAAADRRESMSSLHSQEVALERELNHLKTEYAQLAHDATIQSLRQKAHASNQDVATVRARHEIQTKIDEAAAHAKKHELELKTELAEAFHHDKLLQIKEKQAELRHEKS